MVCPTRLQAIAFCKAQARNPHDAEDLVQEAFVRIWRLYGHTEK